MAGLRNVTMRQLQIFSSAARHLSFSRTSEELHLTQPAVSMQIKQLEDSAGLPLFERIGKRVVSDRGRRRALSLCTTGARRDQGCRRDPRRDEGSGGRAG